MAAHLGRAVSLISEVRSGTNQVFPSFKQHLNPALLAGQVCVSMCVSVCVCAFVYLFLCMLDVFVCI